MREEEEEEEEEEGGWVTSLNSAHTHTDKYVLQCMGNAVAEGTRTQA